MKDLKLSSSLTNLDRVGETTTKKLKSLGLQTALDLLFYFPFRYENYSQRVKIKDIELNKPINIIAKVDLIQNKRSFKKKKNITEALISDETGVVKIIWFNQSFLVKNIKVGDTISIAGVASDKFGQIIIVSPQYEKVLNDKLYNTQGLVPIYSLSSNLTQKQIRYYISQIIHLNKIISEWLPETINKKLKLIKLSEAIYKIHFPKDSKDLMQARLRLEFGELFIRQIKTLLIKENLNFKEAYEIKFKEGETKDFVKNLNFQLTNDQKKSAWEILKDIKKKRPMSRLLEGDVGSGKTIVAAIAILNNTLNQYQSVLMAPTEILARQHYNTLINLFKNYNFKISLLISSEKKANFKLEKKGKVKNILEKSDIIIGTHSLLFQNHPKKLALSIIDEQHRFGVMQRQYLSNIKDGKKTPHFLSLTATPIPRSLALTIYGDLDLSIISEKPKNRKEIITKIVKEENRDKVYQFIKEKVKNGEQVFIICPLIDDSDKLEVKSAKEEHKRLSEEIFPEFKLGLLHGKLKGEKKEEIMNKFLNKEIDILISTSVIEVGIDIKNATIMLIEGAERFGLSQLHQFRGRVGRGDKQSFCFLFVSKNNHNLKTQERLYALTKYNDGLSLAKIDLSLRGGGDLYGKIQSGFFELKLASLFDLELIKLARREAKEIIKNNKSLTNYPKLKEKIGKFEDQIHLE